MTEVKTFLKRLSLIHLALVIGVSVFLIISYLQLQEFNSDLENGDPLLYIVPVFALMGYFGSQFFMKKSLSQLDKERGLMEKLHKYQNACILQYTMLEGPALLSIVAYLKTGNALPLVIAVCLILYLAVQRPNKEKVMMTIPLRREEKDLFSKL